MKHYNFLSILAVSALSLIAASCTNESEPIENVEPAPPHEVILELTAAPDMSIPPESRTTYDVIANNGLNPKWKEGDVVGLRWQNSSYQRFIERFELISGTISSDGKKAKFKCTTSTLPTYGKATFTMFYPYSTSGEVWMGSQTGKLADLGKFHYMTGEGTVDNGKVTLGEFRNRIAVIRLPKGERIIREKGNTTRQICFDNTVYNFTFNNGYETGKTVSKNVSLKDGAPTEDLYFALGLSNSYYPIGKFIFGVNHSNGYVYQEVDCGDTGVGAVVTLHMHPLVPNEIFTVSGIMFKMIGVQGGTFTMGPDPRDKYGYSPAHQVTLSDYLIGECEVTQDLYKAVQGDNPSKYKGDKLPVHKLFKENAVAFAQRLTTATGRKFFIPSEAQWEYAALGGRHSKGYTYSGSDYLDAVAWYEGNTDGKTYRTVMNKQPNELGIYDMSGNVWEWVADMSGRYPTYAVTDPEAGLSWAGIDNDLVNCHLCRGGAVTDGGTAIKVRYYSVYNEEWFIKVLMPGMRVALLPQ
ncbi:MAG: SUMF1/EgtB/PvdO family nonheme iron enzyme [Muribaculaceae bacterium]|nr:SUMF1/EgtB/PvdO family nonheme iron enzyme [Muribaculaceae bacterium]